MEGYRAFAVLLMLTVAIAAALGNESAALPAAGSSAVGMVNVTLLESPPSFTGLLVSSGTAFAEITAAAVGMLSQAALFMGL